MARDSASMNPASSSLWLASATPRAQPTLACRKSSSGPSTLMAALAAASLARSASVRYFAASRAHAGSIPSRASHSAASRICRPRISRLTESATESPPGRCTKAPPERPVLIRTSPCTSRIRSASRTVVRLMRVCTTMSRSVGSEVPSGNSPLRMRSRRSSARTSEAFGTCIGASRTGRWAVAGSPGTGPHLVTSRFWSYLTYHLPGRTPMEGLTVQWNLSPEQDAYQEAFRAWLSDVAAPDTVRRWLDAGDAAAFEQLFTGGGWSGVGLPEELGGQGGGLVELALTAEGLAGAAAPSAGWLATMLTAPALALAGHRDLVQLALAGETAAYLVPADRVPDEAPPLSVDTGGAISGSVPRVLAGDTAVRFVVPVVAPGTREDIRRPASGRELRLVEAGAHVTRTRRKLLDRSRSVADVTLDRAPSQRLTLPAGPAEVLRQASARAAVLVAADSLGAPARMLDLAVTYSKQRRQFGVPIGSFQAVKHAAATILVGVEAGRAGAHLAPLS